LRYSAAEFPAGFALGGNKAVAALDIDHRCTRRASFGTILGENARSLGAVLHEI